jgi:hypothetical protein
MATGGEGDTARIDAVLLALSTAWRANPDLRLGQLVVNAAGDADPFYVEDDELLAGLDTVADGLGYPDDEQ